MGELIPRSPDVVAGEKEVVGQNRSVHTVENLVVVEADIVEAYILGLGHEAAATLLVESVAVEIVVDGVVVDHLRDRQIVEEARRVDALEVFGEALHYHSLADAEAALKHDVLVELVTAAGEHLLGQRAVVEIVEQEPDHAAVVVVDDKRTVLRLDDYIVGDIEKQVGVHLIDSGVGEIGVGLSGACAVVVDALDNLADLHGRVDSIIGRAVSERCEDTAIPLDIPRRNLSEARELVDEALRILAVIHG